jgi:polyvinyl alcohol dehydrogenase (cytochrome)
MRFAALLTLLSMAHAAPPANLYQQFCAACHDSPASPRIPTKAALTTMTPAAIEKALSTGVMAHQGASLPEPDRVAIAKWLGSTVASERTQVCDAGRPSQPNRQLLARDVPHLKLKWAFGFPKATMVRSQPAVYGGRLFTGSQDGTVYALDPGSGCVLWTSSLGAEIRSAITVGEHAIFFGDASGKVTALDTATGRQLWQVQADDHPATRLTGAPVYWKGRLYVPVSSSEEASALQPGYVCCTFRGSVLALDASSGRVIWKSYTIGELPTRKLRTRRGTSTVGPSGAAVWSAPTIDAERNAVYVTTGDNYSDPVTKTSDALLAFDLDNGKLLWSRQFTEADAMNLSCWQPAKVNCPDADGPDFDFGAPPILVKLGGKRRAVVVSQKSGWIYAVDPDAQGRPLWQSRAAEGGIAGGIQWGPAADADRLYVAISDMGMRQPAVRKPGGPRYEIDPRKGGGMLALRLSDGKRVWHTPPPGCDDRRPCSPAQMSAVTAIRGAVFSGSVDGFIRAYSTADGRILWNFDTARAFETINRVPAHGGSLDVAGAVVAGGMLYVNSGYDFLGGMPGNVLLAFMVE